MAGAIQESLAAKALWPSLEKSLEERYLKHGSPLFSSNFKWFISYRTSPMFGIFRIKGTSNEA